MQFIHKDLGAQQRGKIVEVTLTAGANVRLMDSSNFSSYKNGRQHRYYGGLAKRSPIRLAIPNSGHWHVAVDMQGLVGSTRTSVRILPAPLPEIRETPLPKFQVWLEMPHRRLLNLMGSITMFLFHMHPKTKKVLFDL